MSELIYTGKITAMEPSPNSSPVQLRYVAAQTDPTLPLKTRHDCTILGMKVFASVMAGSSLVAAVAWLAMHASWDGQSTVAILKQLLAAWVIAVPPAVFIGAIVGFEMYRLAAGSVRWRETWFLVWIVAFFCLTYLTVLLYLAYRHRRERVVKDRPPTWWLPICYLLLLLFLACALGAGARPENSVGAFICCGFLSLFLSDSVVVNVIARWRNEGRLAAPVSHKFQYSLGTLLIFVLGLGSWLTALVKMFGG